MRLRSIVALSVILALSAALVGCSGGDAEPTPEPRASEEQSSTGGPTAESTTERRQTTSSADSLTPAAEFRGFPVYRMTITDFSGGHRDVTDEAKIDAAVPWAIVLPAYLPSGYDEIGSVQVDQPMQNLQADAAARATRVHVSFITGLRESSFMLILSGGHVGTDGAEVVRVNGQPGQFGVNAVGAQTLSWDLCGRTLMLGALEQDLARDELVRIAESVPEQCE